MCVCVCVCVYIYIYIYMMREAEEFQINSPSRITDGVVWCISAVCKLHYVLFGMKKRQGISCNTKAFIE